MKFLNQPLRRWPFLAFILVQGLLIFLGAINWRTWVAWEKFGKVVDGYSVLTNTINRYALFAPPVDAQLIVRVHAAGPPAFDEVVGSRMAPEAELRLVAIENVFLDYKNVPLLLELVSRHFFVSHPEYKTAVVSLGYYKVPSREAWRTGERVTMRKSLDMTFQRVN